MLQRTISRQGAESVRRRWRPIAATLVIAGGLYGLYNALPEPRPRLRPLPASDAAVRALAEPHRTQEPATDAHKRELAAFGRKLFHDARLSADGRVACVSCHDPAHSYADGLPNAIGMAPMDLNAPSLVNVNLFTWFGPDGRSDSLAAQVLHPLEDPQQLGSSRTHAARLVAQQYASEYEHLFGGFPEPLDAAQLPDDALPLPLPAVVSIEVSAYALSTIGHFPIMKDVLGTAQHTRLAPAMELSRRALAQPALAPPAWVQAWDALPPAQRMAVNQVTANIGRAIAAFEAGLSAVDAPFDRFAARLAAGKTVAESLDTGFGERELTGLKLFTGPGACDLCHQGPGFTDQQFHNIGLPQKGPRVDLGRAAGALFARLDPFSCLGKLLPSDVSESCRELPFLEPQAPGLVGAFKTPSLRNVAATAPYMHDGRFSTLAEVVEHYNELRDRPAIGHREGTLQPLDFTEEEVEALVAFLGALTSPVRDVNTALNVGANP